jgi:hypothetical protein
MSRIRSVHPSLFTDEGFMSLTPHSQVFMIGLWTECDDQGAFEWKPLTLKARLRPVADVDAAELLAELDRAGFIKKYDVDGKAFGAVRNFQKFQRPKKPKNVHPVPDGLLSYLGWKPPKEERVPHQYPTSGEKSPQMEDGGWRMEGEENSDANASSSPSPQRAGAPAVEPQRDPDFSRFYEAFPRKVGIDDAEDEYVRAVEKGADPAFLLDAVKDYARRHVGDDARFVTTPAKWLRDKRWAEYKPPSGPVCTEPKVEIRTDDPRWRLLKERYVRERKRNPPTVSGSWHFPASWVSELPQAEAAA